MNQSINQWINPSINQNQNAYYGVNWESIYACFAGAVEFFLLVGVQLLLQRKAH